MDTLALYHRLPAPLKNLAATGRGMHLKYWRYGRHMGKLVEQVKERDRWTAEQWTHWQEERLSLLLDRAVKHVPYYRQQWAKRRQAGDKASSQYLENWPLLSKQSLRQTPLAFVADDLPQNSFFQERTSGTSGTPLAIYLQREVLQLWYAMYEERIRHWHGVSIQERWAIMGGQMVIPFAQQAPPFWVHNYALNQLYLSTHHMSEQNVPAYIEKLNRYSPTHMVVYPSSANVMAHTMLQKGLKSPESLKVIFSNAEKLLPHQRETIAQAFDCRVIDTYGMGEFVAGGSEAQDGNFYLWPDVGLVESLIDEGNAPVEAGQIGRFIATGLLNIDMPLIRYQVGDRGIIQPSTPNPNRLAMPIIEKIEGRSNDLIVTPDGRKIFWLNPVFYGLPIKESQITQYDLHTLEVKIVPTNENTTHLVETISTRLRDYVGPSMSISVHLVPKLERTALGKLRSIISHVN